MNYIRESVEIVNIENTVRCCVTNNPLTLESIKDYISNQELRRTWVQLGEEDAIQFLTNIRNKPNIELNQINNNPQIDYIE